MGKLSNLSLNLYSWYIKLGHARDEKDVSAVKMFFEANLPAYNIYAMDFYEKMYLYQSYCWYGFYFCRIFANVLSLYTKMGRTFLHEPAMITIETGQYIKAMHNLFKRAFRFK